MAAHLFGFYYGVVSGITTPVALAAFAAAALAGTPQMSTAVESARLGIAKYIVPFAFVYNPALVFEGPLWLTAYSGLSVLAGVGALSVAIEGWLYGALTPGLRGLAGAAAVALMYAPTIDLLGLPGYAVNGAGGLGFALIYLARSRARGDRSGAGQGVRP